MSGSVADEISPFDFSDCPDMIFRFGDGNSEEQEVPYTQKVKVGICGEKS